MIRVRGDLAKGFFQFPLPKYLIIQNKRLGAVYRLLQLGVFIGTTLYVWYSRPWIADFVPQPQGVVMWSERADADLQANMDVPHCSDLDSYTYRYSASWAYNATSCKSLRHGDIHNKDIASMYYPTYVKDDNHWHSSGDDCSVDAATNCAKMGGKFSQSGVQCECFSSESYFVRNPEEERVGLLHGYEVSTSVDSSTLQSAHSASDIVEEGDRMGKKNRFEQAMLTIIQHQDGTECNVGGKAVYDSLSSRVGIIGTVREWMTCAGVTLDSRSDRTRSFEPAENMEPHLRTTGLILNFELIYQTRQYHSVPGHAGVVCYVKVRAIPAWNSRAEMAYTELPNPFSMRTAYRHRYSQGITIQVRTTGSFGFFDLTTLVNGIISVIVLLGAPIMIMEFISTFLLGLLSDIYSKAQRQVLNIYNEFHGSTSRMMVASLGFRGLSNQWHVRSKDLEGLQLVDFRYHMREVFHREMAFGVFDSEDVDRLADVVYHGLDAGTASDSGVGFADFVHACSSNEVLTRRHMAAFFDRHRRPGLFERVLDDTPRDISPHLRRQMRGFSENLEDEDNISNVPCMSRSRQFDSSSRSFPTLPQPGDHELVLGEQPEQPAMLCDEDVRVVPCEGVHTVACATSPSIPCPACGQPMRLERFRGCDEVGQPFGNATADRSDTHNGHKFWVCMDCSMGTFCNYPADPPRGPGADAVERCRWCNQPEGVSV